MLDKNDPYYGALLIEEARLHLGTVMAGQDSEPFFMAMLQIVEANVHYGYTTLRNKEVRLKGIKDFLHSVYYGLGIRDMETFLSSILKSSLKETSRSKYSYKFIDWLKEQDESFCFPQAFFEYRRLTAMVFRDRRMPKLKKLTAYKTIKFLYNTAPEILQHIGHDRKYKTVEACYYGEGYQEKQEILKPIKTYRNPTKFQLGQLADSLVKRLGKGRTRMLALMLLELCKNETAAGEWDSGNDDDVSAAGSEWVE